MREVDMLRKTTLIAAAAMLMAAPQAAGAGDWRHDFQDEMKRVEGLAKQGVEEVVRTLDKALSKLPRYGLPEILPNGDIIIRRHPAPPARAEEPDITETSA